MTKNSKKKLETILGNLYRIDHEAREYLSKEKGTASNMYERKPRRDKDPKSPTEDKDETSKTYTGRQQSL